MIGSIAFSRFPDETEKKQSRFQREKKAKEAEDIVAERSYRFLMVCL